MTPAEVSRLLAIAAAFDGRIKPESVSDAQAKTQAWAEALPHDMTWEWARQAVVAHYRDSTEVLMPAHLMRRWRADRRLEADRRALAASTGNTEAVRPPEEFRAALAALSASKGMPE